MTAVQRYLFSFEPAISTKGSSWHVELESLLPPFFKEPLLPIHWYLERSVGFPRICRPGPCKGLSVFYFVLPKVGGK